MSSHYKAIDWCILAYSVFTFSKILKPRAYRVFTFGEIFKSLTWLDNYITFNIQHSTNIPVINIIVKGLKKI